MKAATVNRVDLYMRDSGAGISHSLPQVMGVDGAGVIEEADSGALIGRRVTLYPGVVCGQCEFCKRGDPVLCAKMSLLGEHRDGTSTPRPSVNGMISGAIASGGAFTVASAPRPAARASFSELREVTRTRAPAVLAICSAANETPPPMPKTRTVAPLQLRFGEQHAPGGEIVDTKSRGLGKLEIVGDGQPIFGGNTHELGHRIGGPIWNAALKCLVRGGRIVTCGATIGDQPPADLRRVFIRQLQIFGSTLGNPDEFTTLLAWCAQGRLVPPIDTRYPLDQICTALSHLESGAQFGKIAIEI
jgi:NADPH:quinone reductase-like Zn-dependent oxidoreductase